MTNDPIQLIHTILFNRHLFFKKRGMGTGMVRFVEKSKSKQTNYSSFDLDDDAVTNFYRRTFWFWLIVMNVKTWTPNDHHSFGSEWHNGVTITTATRESTFHIWCKRLFSFFSVWVTHNLSELTQTTSILRDVVVLFSHSFHCCWWLHHRFGP